MKSIKIWASCEHCGLAWVEEKKLPKYWKEIKCKRCGYKTANYDSVNHNKGVHFISYLK